MRGNHFDVSVRTNVVLRVVRGDTPYGIVLEQKSAVIRAHTTIGEWRRNSELSVILPARLASKPMEIILDAGAGPSVIDLAKVRERRFGVANTDVWVQCMEWDKQFAWGQVLFLSRLRQCILGGDP